MPRQSMSRMKSGTKSTGGTYKVDGNSVYQDTVETTPVPNNFSFTKLKKGTVFKINRPNFTYRGQKVQNENVQLPKNRRTGTGNFNITRPLFRSPPIRGRDTLDFEKMELQTLEDAGAKISLGDETLARLFNVQVADPTDTDWLAEYEKRKQAGETDEEINASPPFRRPQRTKTERINFATQGLRLNDKLELLQTAVMSNSVETREELKAVVTSVAVILGETKDLSEKQSLLLKGVVDRLHLPRNYKEAGLSEQFYNSGSYDKEIGPIHFFIMSMVKSRGIAQNQVVTNTTNTSGLATQIGFSSIKPTLLRNGNILDVQALEIITLAEARNRGYETATDNLGQTKQEEDEDEDADDFDDTTTLGGPILA